MVLSRVIGASDFGGLIDVTTSFSKQARCLICALERSVSEDCVCSCGGLMDPYYDLTKARINNDSLDPVVRYLDLLPLERSAIDGSFEFGRTPCIHAQRYGERIGLRQLYLKLDNQNPTGTTKDRMASCCMYAYRHFNLHRIVLSSTGNTANTFSHAAEREREIAFDIFLSETDVPKLRHYPPQVTVHCVKGDYVAASAAAKRFAQENDLYLDRGFANYLRREGGKTAFLEAFEQIGGIPDVIAQAISSGIGVLAANKASQEYGVLSGGCVTPRICAVQQASCSPMVSAFHDGAKGISQTHIVRHPTGIADAILMGDPTEPYPYVRGVIMACHGTFVAVSAGEILSAHQQVRELEGVQVCLNSACTLAGVARLATLGWIDPSERVLALMTGAEKATTEASHG